MRMSQCKKKTAMNTVVKKIVKLERSRMRAVFFYIPVCTSYSLVCKSADTSVVHYLKYWCRKLLIAIANIYCLSVFYLTVND